jgi:hypothetical protein
LMSATLTPLPSPHPGISARSAAPRTWNILPFPVASAGISPPVPSTKLPAWPGDPGTAAAEFPATWPSPLTVLPAAGGNVTPDDEDFAPTPFPQFGEITEIPSGSAVPPPFAASGGLPDFTDADLLDALGPIMEQVVRNSGQGDEVGISPQLEPMLRATIRRALAEYAPASRPFQPPGVFDRFIWHLKALFTSRTYEDILFEKTRRFQVEEVFLLDSRTLALISFASCDPARHSSVRRVSGTAQRLALQLRDGDGSIRRHIELSDHRHLVVREGSRVVLMALVRGRPGELVAADLDFALRRIEDQFREQFGLEGSSMLYEIQPFLEDCLLIQSPATAA